MANQKENLGNCRFCGEPIIQTDKGWGCSGYKNGCKAFIWKNDFFFQKVFGKKVNKAQAIQFLKGNIVIIKNAIIKGKKCEASLTFVKTEDNKFKYDMHLEFPNKF